MMPKSKENPSGNGTLSFSGHGYPEGAYRYAPILPPHQQYMSQFVPANVVIQAPGDIDSILQVHRRKMLRRAANRRSAQQSRARKKVISQYT